MTGLYIQTRIVPPTLFDDAGRRNFERLRYLEYCVRLGWEPKNPSKLETDRYDQFSAYILMRQPLNPKAGPGGLVAGCRVIDGRRVTLPSVEKGEVPPLPLNECAEVSRLICLGMRESLCSQRAFFGTLCEHLDNEGYKAFVASVTKRHLAKFRRSWGEASFQVIREFVQMRGETPTKCVSVAFHQEWWRRALNKEKRRIPKVKWL